jgi:hypothetical protein
MRYAILIGFIDRWDLLERIYLSVLRCLVLVLHQPGLLGLEPLRLTSEHVLAEHHGGTGRWATPIVVQGY